MSEGPNCVEAQICRGDFYYMLAEALKQCGGSNGPATIQKYQQMRLCEVVDVLAQNGIRMVYKKEFHLDSVS